MGLPRSRDLAFGETPVRCCRGWHGGRDLSSTATPPRGPQVPNPGCRQQKRKQGHPGQTDEDQSLTPGTCATSPSGLEALPDPQAVPCLFQPLTAWDDSEHHAQVPLGPVVDVVSSFACQELHSDRYKEGLCSCSPVGTTDRALRPELGSGDIVHHSNGRLSGIHHVRGHQISMPCIQRIRSSSPWYGATARQVPKCRGPTPRGPTASRPGPDNQTPTAKSGTEPSGRYRPRTTEWTQFPGIV